MMICIIHEVKHITIETCICIGSTCLMDEHPGRAGGGGNTGAQTGPGGACTSKTGQSSFIRCGNL